MRKAAGLKLVNMAPCPYYRYIQIIGAEIPEDSENIEGYLVEYFDGRPANVSGYYGYVSWSPKKPVEETYRYVDDAPFSIAFELLKVGRKLARTTWEKGVYLYLVCGNKHMVGEPPAWDGYTATIDVEVTPHIVMKTLSGDVVPWSFLEEDIMAENWCMVD